MFQAFKVDCEEVSRSHLDKPVVTGRMSWSKVQHNGLAWESGRSGGHETKLIVFETKINTINPIMIDRASIHHAYRYRYLRTDQLWQRQEVCLDSAYHAAPQQLHEAGAALRAPGLERGPHRGVPGGTDLVPVRLVVQEGQERLEVGDVGGLRRGRGGAWRGRGVEEEIGTVPDQASP